MTSANASDTATQRPDSASAVPTREQLLHALYEAAELEHNLMCTYLYAVFSLRQGEAEGLSPREAEALVGWRATMLRIAVEEMSHLVAVWNITAALGGSPRFGRGNFPLDPGMLPAGLVVKLAPFGEDVLQHFIHLERPESADERDGASFAPQLFYARDGDHRLLTPIATDYATVGTFYATLGEQLARFCAAHGEGTAFCGDPRLQLSQDDVALEGAQPVRCLKTAQDALDVIVRQGEGAPADAAGSHFQRFLSLRDEYRALCAQNPAFTPAFASATNPVLRRPMRAEGRVWIEDPRAVATVDLANAGYALMLRLMAYAYVLPSPSPEKRLVVDLSVALMRAITPLAEHAARLPAGPAHPECNAGMSFTALRDAAPLLRGAGAHAFIAERFAELSAAATALAADGEARTTLAAAHLALLRARATRLPELAAREAAAKALAPTHAPVPPPVPAPPSTHENGIERVTGERLTIVYEGRRCIHARFCVTGGPKVFLANVEGPWIHPDAMDAERVAEIAHACPSGAIRYERSDGAAEETPPPVNLIGVREAGPYAFRGAIELDGVPGPFRATLCRCGASKRKPYCDGSHHEVHFAASGEPTSGQTTMLPVRDGVLAIDPTLNGPLAVRGNMEIISGTGRVVARTTSARLCRCGASGTKPFCDNSHVRVGFRST